ncbi:MAG: RpiB/LacA/LacB family sugar-phosphate isomerase [Candidatus Liptonbacteria bacterium]|nr:RpiB/LacA/LacB family sugar-phosphate isomerase [Candidatus Liptonbacteria bacterium]
MVIYLGADHRGFQLKELLKQFLHQGAFEVADLGGMEQDPEDDYPDYAAAVARRVGDNTDQARGILICGSGAGMAIAANKVPRIRAGLALSNDQVFAARDEDDINILCLAADFITEADAQQMVKVFLNTPFAGTMRYRRRIEKVSQIEHAALGIPKPPSP